MKGAEEMQILDAEAKEAVEHFKSLMRSGLDHLHLFSEPEIASEYFGDAAHVLKNDVPENLQGYCENLFEVNPLDFAY